ncbi:MAG TPA: HIT family protein [Burkholderiaceae bacterium]|nr:HIT family protein [Burkholderiaceae bacterium]
MTGCELCEHGGGLPVWSDERLRVVRVDDDGFPAYYRVIWNVHVPEFSDLAYDDREHCMNVVAAVERVLREQLSPMKVNLASLGNLTPHLHWHVLARFEWDSHYPNPIWAAAKRRLERPAMEQLGRPMLEVDRAVLAVLGEA